MCFVPGFHEDLLLLPELGVEGIAGEFRLSASFSRHGERTKEAVKRNPILGRLKAPGSVVFRI